MSALSPRQAFLLDLACQPLREAFPDYGPYLVGTAQRYQKGDPAPRDVDVRCVTKDDVYDAMLDAMGVRAMRFLCLAIGQYIASLTDLPIDFQFQRMTAANDGRFPAHGGRQPLGMGNMGNFVGDAEPASGEGLEPIGTIHDGALTVVVDHEASTNEEAALRSLFRGDKS